MPGSSGVRIPLCEPARDEALLVDINVECKSAFASRLAPTGAHSRKNGYAPHPTPNYINQCPPTTI